MAVRSAPWWKTLWHAERLPTTNSSCQKDRLRQAPNGYFYDNITNGFGQMLGYSAQIPPRDRWAIIAYIRALQLSRNMKAADLPAELREKLNQSETPAAKPSAPKDSTGGSF